jgi:hypothetical protein
MSQPNLSRNRLVIVLLGLVALLAIIIYWPTIKLPLIYDDLLHIRIVDDLNLLSVWLPTKAFGFYRPLTFFPLLIVEAIFSRYPSELLHGINIFQHALNGVLLGWLSWRLWQRLHWAIAAALIIVFFPFAYQAIAVYGHNVHPTVTGIILLALHTYLSAIRSSGRARTAWWIVTAFLFLMSLLSHESAIIFGFLAATVHFNETGHFFIRTRGSDSFLSQPWILFLVAGTIYFIGYQFLPLSRAPQASFEVEALRQKIYYLLQGAGYPLAWFGQWLPENLGVLVVGLGFFLMVILSAWSARDRFNRLPLALGWSWWLLASLVLAIPLSASYLLHGPRLLYLSAAGVAILWPVLLEPVYQLKRFGRLIWLAVMAIILLTSGIFIRGRLQAYDTLTEPVKVMEEVLQDRPAEEGVIFVNLPQWLAPESNTYPIGVEFVAMLGDYLFVEELVRENLDVDRPVLAREVVDLLANPSYTYAVHDQDQFGSIEADWTRSGSHIFITNYGADEPATMYTGQLIPLSFQTAPLASFGPYQLLKVEADQCDGIVNLVTTWRQDESRDPSKTIEPTTSIFVQLVDNDGQLVNQADGPLLGLRPDLIEVTADWELIDRRMVENPGNKANQLLAGVYDYLSGERYRGYDNEGQPLEDDALVIVVEECRQ